MPIVLNGSTNVISGLAVGGLPDGIVDTDMLAANAVTTAKIDADAVTGAKVADDAVGSEHIEQLDSNLQIDRDKYIGTVASGQSTINIGTSGGSQIGFHKINTNDDELRFYTHTSGSSHAERMRIHIGGQVSIGNTTTNTTATGITLQPNSVSSFYTVDDKTLYIGRGGSNGNVVQWNRSAETVGSVSVTTTGTTYGSSSDYRLKENITSISDGITRLKTLKPSRFNFKIDKDTTVDGFIAHEVTAVPEAIVGTKDEVDKDNKPVYQEIDQSKLVPLLTAALQEAVAKIETLDTKVTALEAA